MWPSSQHPPKTSRTGETKTKRFTFRPGDWTLGWFGKSGGGHHWTPTNMELLGGYEAHHSSQDKALLGSILSSSLEKVKTICIVQSCPKNHGKMPYCWWFRNPARKPPAMYKKSLVNNGINYLYLNWFRVSEPSTVSLSKRIPSKSCTDVRWKSSPVLVAGGRVLNLPGPWTDHNCPATSVFFVLTNHHKGCCFFSYHLIPTG